MRRNHYVWIGLVVTFVSAVSYFTLFSRVPALRDFPWVNLPLVVLGVALSAVGARRAFASPGAWRKVAGSGALAVSALLGALFCGYVFFLSYLLPEPTALTMQLDRAPDVTLLDHRGRPVGLDSLRGRKVVLTFYRGHW